MTDVCGTVYQSSPYEPGQTCGRPAGHDGAHRMRPTAVDMTEPTTDAYDAAIAYAAEQGRKAGQSAAGWYEITGHLSFGPDQDRLNARRILAMIEDGDPALNLPRADLSGQWADTLTGPELVEDAVWRAYGGLWDDRPELAAAVADWSTDICDAYETAFSEAAQDAIASAARAILE